MIWELQLLVPPTTFWICLWGVLSLLHSLISEGALAHFIIVWGAFHLCSSWVSLPTFWGPSAVSYFFFCFFNTTSGKIKPKTIDLPHLAPSISKSLCSQERSFSCCFVFGILLLAVSSLPGAGVSCNYFRSVWERKEAHLMASPSKFLYPSASFGDRGRLGGQVGQFWKYWLTPSTGWQSHLCSWVKRKSLWAPRTVFSLSGSLISRSTCTHCSPAKLHSLDVRKIFI